MMNIVARIQEWKGSLISYLGGTGVTMFSSEVAARAEDAAKVTGTYHEVTLANWLSLGGLIVIAARLIFDVYVHIDKKRQAKLPYDQS